MNTDTSSASTDATTATAAISFAECPARERLALLLDAGSFHEWLPPAERVMSPHLLQLGVPTAFDDGVAIGRATLDGRPVFVAAQEGAFMGGGVGEVHGAKLVGLLQRALRDRPAAVLLLAESGGVRLHEANAGLIAVSEVMRALLDVRAAGIPVLVLIGGANGCFGGMGIVARCADWIVMSDTGRLAMSGPEVIEASHGVEEFDSRDRALVWRTTGGKHRWLTGDCDLLVEDDVAAFRQSAIGVLASPGASRPPSPDTLEAEHALLAERLRDLPEADWGHDGDDATKLWQRLGIPATTKVPDLDVGALHALRHAAA
jgi:malonate decarboxylase beta subunit